MTHGEDCNESMVISVKNDIGAAAERNEPLAKLRWHIVDGATDLRMGAECLHPLANDANGALRCNAILLGQKLMKARYILECSLRPDEASHGHRSSVGLGWLDSLASLELREPSVRLFGSHMFAGLLIRIPGRKRIASKSLARLFALDILLDRLPHQPMCGTLARCGEAPQA